MGVTDARTHAGAKAKNIYPEPQWDHFSMPAKNGQDPLISSPRPQKHASDLLHLSLPLLRRLLWFDVVKQSLLIEKGLIMPAPDDSSAGQRPPTTAENPPLSSSQQSGASVQPEPVCSVLNVVVNHAMRPPTALEPLEFKQEQERQSREQQHPEMGNDTGKPSLTAPTLVPVLRIFGPIVRRDTSPDNRKPVQSACLYIHGAYPYLLARPRLAGPDGSLHPFRSAEQRHIDWDDYEAVRRIVPVLTSALETAIVASSSFHLQDDAGSTPAAASIIRRITVVQGRGFFTYCPGPVAPFLRVEYYNPAERWRVKRALEQGLDVEVFYHPDARQYMTATGQGPVPKEEDAGLLRFHCYEAHIPYTMQFFKDYNLAGLSYIHLQNPRFRCLPRKRRQSYALYEEEQVENHAMFLESNASQYLWPGGPSNNGQTSSLTPIVQQTFTSQEDQSSQSSVHRRSQTSVVDPELDTDIWHPPPVRETICDVEIDVHVRDILNVLDIMTEQQSGSVHWRAVPSLRELWAEERQRMELLLPKTEENISFTLSVKSPKSAQPGTALAVQGMKKLLDASESFVAQDFERSALQIRDRHTQAIENVDEAWKLHIESAAATSPTNAASSMDNVLTPNFSQALDALNELGGEAESDNMDLVEQKSSGTPLPMSQNALSQQSQSQHVRFDNATQVYYDGKFTRTTASELELSQRIDRGEGIVDGPFCHIEDFLDPATLRPLEEPEDENSLDEEDDEDFGMESTYERIENEMQILATQTCEDSPRSVPDAGELNFLVDDQETSNIDLNDDGGCLMELEDPSDDDVSETRSASLGSHAPAVVDSDALGSRKRSISVFGASRNKNKETGSAEVKRVALCYMDDDSDAKNAQANVLHNQNSTVHTPPCERTDESLVDVNTMDDGHMNDGSDSTNHKSSSPALFQQPETPSDGVHSQVVALQGMGNQGGRLWVQGGGTLKAKTRHSQFESAIGSQHRSHVKSLSLASPVTIMSIETHVQCRTGRAGYNDVKKIAMVPNSEKDRISAVVYVFGRDPGGGEALEILERGCIFVPVERELSAIDPDQRSKALKSFAQSVKVAMPDHSMGVKASISVECAEDERKLLLRLTSKVVSKDPDMLLSWDPQGSGLGYLVERGMYMANQEINRQGNEMKMEIDMARLLGRVRTSVIENTKENSNNGADKDRWKGSGLGKDWDERVGPGVAAASIEGRLIFSTWKLVAEEVKHPNASYLQAVVSSVLNRRIPFHDNLRLTQWYANDRGRERWRVLHHKLTEATAGLLLVDALDMIGRAGEAARLSGVEFSQSFPGIRGSQYKVEGVLLRALKSLNSSERGSKSGVALQSTCSSAETPLSAESKSQTQVRHVESHVQMDLLTTSYLRKSKEPMESPTSRASSKGREQSRSRSVRPRILLFLSIPR